jgi:hypothetical protein
LPPVAPGSLGIYLVFRHYSILLVERKEICYHVPGPSGFVPLLSLAFTIFPFLSRFCLTTAVMLELVEIGSSFRGWQMLKYRGREIVNNTTLIGKKGNIA